MTAVEVEARVDQGFGKLRLRLIDRSNRRGGGRHHGPPIAVDVADAYGTDDRVEVHGTREITIDTRRSGGWYDIALTTQSDPSFRYQIAGRVEFGGRLTSDPQLGRS